MRLRQLDRDIIEFVYRHRQVRGDQIRRLFFTAGTDNGREVRCRATLAHLTATKYLARFTDRDIGRVGSSSYVYQLGQAGWQLLHREGRYWPYRAVDAHTIAITELFVMLTEAEAEKRLTVVAFQPEPACHQTIGGIKLEPDAYMEIGLRSYGLRYSYFVEVELSEKRPRKIVGKLTRYWQAFRHDDPEHHFPFVLFIEPDERHKRQIERLIAGGPDAAQAIFHVVAADTVADWLATEAPRKLAAGFEA